MKKIIVLLALGYLAFVIVVIIFGPYKRMFKISKTSFVVNENFKGFSEQPFNSEIDVQLLKKKYEITRKSALEKANSFINQRDILDNLFNALCVASIIISFMLSYLGASKGTIVSNDSVSQSLESLKHESLAFKKKIILLSSLTIFITTIANRSSAYADKCQNKAGEVIEIIKTADSKVNSSIGLRDAQSVINAFELEITKY